MQQFCPPLISLTLPIQTALARTEIAIPFVDFDEYEKPEVLGKDIWVEFQYVKMHWSKTPAPDLNRNELYKFQLNKVIKASTETTEMCEAIKSDVKNYNSDWK